MGRPKKATIDRVPAEGELDVEKITWGPGWCERDGCKRNYASLRDHFQECHLRVPRCKATYTLKEIPEVGDVPLEDVYAGPGYCNKCKMRKSALRAHYGVHLGLVVKCEKCGKEVARDSIRGHMLTHSGPVKCSLCDKRSASANAYKSHKSTHHRGVKEAIAIPLTEEEATDFVIAKQESAMRTEMRLTGRTVIPQLKTTLEEYERRLRDPEDELKLWERAADLQNAFQTLFEIEEDSLISYNASFVSVWNVDWKIPQLVFEVIHKTEVYEIFEANRFYPDPKVGTLTQPTKHDYAKSGKHRGHLASTADFHEMFLSAPTYYYTNAAPMTEVFNVDVRQPLEQHIRDTGDEHGEAWAAHFPIMEGPIQTIGQQKVRVPPFVGTVMMVEKIDGWHITGWKLHNTDDFYDYRHCVRDPFSLLEEAGIRVKFRREDFVYVSQYQEA